MDKELVISTLQKNDLISGSSVEIKPLDGGVSSDIALVTDGVQKYVIKQALPKLQVADDWHADIARNSIEQDFMRFLNNHMPAAVPELLYHDEERHFFVMEYLGREFQNWKRQMMKGIFDIQTAKNAAKILAGIHLKSWKSKDLQKRFNNAENFYSLRTEPYLLTTGKRHPKLKDIFFEEIERLQNHREALIHGDFSPKNIMVKGNRVVILDHEVAWFGDPAFDLAFFLNHLYLKMLLQYTKKKEIQDLTRIVWNTYFGILGNKKLKEMEPRTGRLLLMMMLARVDGKSPVEYLRKKDKEFIRKFVYQYLPAEMFTQLKINNSWKSEMKKRYKI